MCTIALTWGGITAPWGSAQVLVPLILGIVLLILFLVWDAFFATYPLVPFSLTANRTSLSGWVYIVLIDDSRLTLICHPSSYLQTFFVSFVALGVVCT